MQTAQTDGVTVVSGVHHNRHIHNVFRTDILEAVDLVVQPTLVETTTDQGQTRKCSVTIDVHIGQ